MIPQNRHLKNVTNGIIITIATNENERTQMILPFPLEYYYVCVCQIITQLC